MRNCTRRAKKCRAPALHPEPMAKPRQTGSMSLDKLLNPSQMAEILGVRPGTIYCWISRGVPIPRIKICGTLRFRKETIEAWILAQEREEKHRNFEL